MKTSSRFRLTFLALAVFTGWSTAQADPIHSGDYTITLGSGEMGFSADGNYASFGLGVSPWANPNSSQYFFPGEYWGNGGQTVSLTRTLSAVLQADPGKIFDKVYIGLVPGSVINDGASGAWAESYWTVNGGTYHGDTDYFFGDTSAYHTYTITGASTGESTMAYYPWFQGVYSTWGGFWGTPEYLNGYYDIGASSFSLDLAISAHDWNAGRFNPPGLQFRFTYLDAPAPSASAVPETGATVLLLLSGLSGLALARRFGVTGSPAL